MYISNKIWTTKEGRNIKIRDMSDQHLINTINMLRRFAKHVESEALSAAYSLEATLTGEMALDAIDSEIRRLENDEIDPGELNPKYNYLVKEATKRNII